MVGGPRRGRGSGRPALTVFGCPLVTIDAVADPRLDDYRDLRNRHPRGTGPVIVESMLGLEVLAASPLAIRSVLVTPAKLDRLPALDPRRRPSSVTDIAIQRQLVGFDLHRASWPRPSARPRSTPTPCPGRRPPRRRRSSGSQRPREPRFDLFRNGRAFGADAVLLDPETTDPYGRRPVRVLDGPRPRPAVRPPRAVARRRWTGSGPPALERHRPHARPATRCSTRPRLRRSGSRVPRRCRRPRALRRRPGRRRSPGRHPHGPRRRFGQCGHRSSDRPPRSRRRRGLADRACDVRDRSRAPAHEGLGRRGRPRRSAG